MKPAMLSTANGATLQQCPFQTFENSVRINKSYILEYAHTNNHGYSFNGNVSILFWFQFLFPLYLLLKLHYKFKELQNYTS